MTNSISPDNSEANFNAPIVSNSANYFIFYSEEAAAKFCNLSGFRYYEGHIGFIAGSAEFPKCEASWLSLNAHLRN